MRLARNPAATSRSGVSLVMVGLSICVLATLSVGMVIATRATQKEKSAQREEVAALFAAEAGLSEAVFDLNRGGIGVVGSQQAPQTMNGSEYWVSSADLPNGMKTLVATGVDNRAGMRIELTVVEDLSNLWTWGAFGDEELTMDSNARVDSYDSMLGTYASQQVNGSGTNAYALSTGDVGSNGDIDIMSNSSVQGSAVPGPSSAVTITGTASVSGSTAPNTSLVDLPKLVMPVIGSSGDLKVASTTPVVLPSGDHEFDDLVLGNGAVLTVTGPARIVTVNMELRSNAQIVVDASLGPVEFFVYQDFIMNSSTMIASTTFTPADVSINLNSDNIINPAQTVQLAEVTLESNSVIYGTLFAPNAQVDIDSNFELFGSVVARQVHLDSWARIHFDEQLLNVTNSTSSNGWQAVCWRKVGFQP